jgi:sec-independent protein translocase protein TatA
VDSVATTPLPGPREVCYPGAMPFNLGLPEVLIVLVLALLFLGPKRLPEAGRSLGRGIREFKDGISGNDEDSREARSTTSSLNPPPAYTPPPPPAYTPPAEHTPPPSE